MTTQDKIKTVEDLAAVVEKLRTQGKKIVHCHGVFDLLHIGHIRYFEEARSHGDILVVTLTTDPFVNRGPHRPAFNENLRAQTLASLACIDYVAINRFPTAVEAIKLLRPHFYVKGAEYKDASKDVTGKIVDEQRAVEAAGGRILFTDGIVFSSTALINRHLSVLPPQTQEYLTAFAQRHPPDQVFAYLQNAANLKVLLVGETIIDEYVYCEAIGKSSKEPTLAVKHLSAEKFAGGILAAANHVAGLSNRVSVLTQIGDQNDHVPFIDGRMLPGVEKIFVRRPNSPTIVKRRIVEQYTFNKLIEVYEINDARPTPADDDAVCQALSQRVGEFDVVIVIDFGHGMISDRAAAILRDKAKFLAINAQSNAGNLGYQAVSKYHKPDYMTAQENEIRLEARDRHGDLRRITDEVSRRMGSGRTIVTRGKVGCLCWHPGEGFFDIPAVAGNVVDRVGAGDALLSISSLCAAQNAPTEVVGFVGNAAGALAVATVGHRKSIEKPALFKQIESLLK